MTRISACIFSVSSDSLGTRHLGGFVHKAATVFLSTLLVFQPALLQAQQVTPDTSAAAINQPNVGIAPNGIPLVDIVNPNGQGLSHNKYNSFNVDTPGLILNNHNGEVGKSRLGGVTPGNPNLKNSGPASIILNEVTTQNRSALNGPLEVFGGRADVIIANPNGITCDGCGFVNTPRTTLTTGIPDINANGHLGGFNVTGGDVTFGANGGNFASGNGGVDLFDVVSRSVRVNGPVYGKDLRLTAGRNKFDYATGKATVLDATAGIPEYAIDGSALGALQANRIRMVVTEKGAGVRMRGDMAANAGELSLSSDGKISIGNVSASEDVTLRSKAEVTAARITSKKHIIVQADKGVTLQSVVSDQNAVLNGGIGILAIAGETTSFGNIQLTATKGVSVGSVDAGGVASLTSASGNIVITRSAKSAGDLTITAIAGSITAKSLISFRNIALTSGRDIGVTGDILAAGNLVLSGTSIKSGTMIAGLDFAATKADPNGKTVLGSSDDTTTAGDLRLTAIGGNINAVALLSAGDMSISAANLTAANITSHKNITVNGSSNVSGQILAGQNATITGQTITANAVITGVDFAKTNSSSSGSIVLGLDGNLVIQATSGAVKIGTLLAAGTLDIISRLFTAQNVTGHKTIAITGDTRIAGQLLGGENASITGAGISAGSIVSGVDFARMGHPLSTDVVLRDTGKLSLNATSGNIQVANLLSAGDLFGQASGEITANAVSHGALDLKGGNAISLTGQSLAAGDVFLKAGTLTVHTLVSGVDFAATAASSDGNLRLKTDTGEMNLDATQGSLTAKSLLSGGNLDAHATQNISYDSLQSFGSASLSADQGSVSIDKRTSAQGDLTLTTQTADLSNNRGQIATAKNLIINATSANFAGSKLTYGGLGLNLTASADFTGASVRAVTNSGGSGNIDIKATTVNTSSSTTLLAQNDLTLTLSSLANAGQLAAGRDLTFNVNGDLTNTPTGLIYVGNDAKLYVTGNLTNNQGAIMAGHDLAIAANANNAKNQSVTNISGLIRAENDASISTENLTNKRLTNPTWEKVLVSDGSVTKFELNPEMLGKPYAQLFSSKGDGYELFYKDVPKQFTSSNLGKLWSQAMLSDGSSYRTNSWEDTWEKFGSGHSKTAPLNWLSQVVPKDSEGNFVLDPNKTSRYFVMHNGKSNSTFYLKYKWVDSNKISQTVHEDRLAGNSSPEAMLHVGGNLAVDATMLSNSYSSIETGGDTTLKGGVLNNEGVAFHRTTLTQCEAKGGCEAYDAAGKRNAANDLGNRVSKLTSDVAIGGVGGTIKAAGNLDINGVATINNTAAAGSMAGSAKLATLATPDDPTLGLTGLTAGTALFTPIAAITGLQQSGSLFAGQTGVNIDPAQVASIKTGLLSSIVKPDSGGFGGTVPGQVFLYETRAEFLDVSKFYGSGYFINRIGYHPDRAIPFLGDAYYENQLIDRQLHQLVGQGLGKGSFIPGSDAIEQMKLLLDNGIEYAKQHNLKIGKQLSVEQIAALTQSIVIYEKKIVQGVEVLVPVVYLANADKTNLTVAGALISGGSVNMDVGNINNSGAITAKTDVKIAGTNIKANGGSFIAGGNVKLVSSGDLTLNAQSLNIGGTNIINPNVGIKAGGNASLAASNDLTLKGVSVNAGGNADLAGKNVTLDVAKARNKGTELATGANVTVGGNITIAANDNVNIIGSKAKAGGSLDVNAINGSVNVVTADVAKGNIETGKNASRMAATTQQQSELASGSDTSIKSGDDILISGSKVNAGGKVNLKADDDINITTAQSHTESSRKGHSSSVVTNSGSEITAGGSITATAGGPSTAGTDKGDLNIIGSKLAASGKVQLKADGDITIAQAQDSSVVDTETSSKRLFSSKKTTTHTETTTAVGSDISGGSGVDISSGDNTTISASKLAAGTADKKADIDITTGGDLTIASGKDTLERHDRSSGTGFLTKKSAKLDSYDERTIASELGASGNVNLNAGNNAVIAGSNVTAGESIDVEADNVSVIGAQEDHELATQKKKSGIGAGSGGGFYSVWGKEKKDSKQSAMLNAPSSLSAGRDVVLTARETDVNILGSGVEAGNDIILDAARDVNILPGAESASSYEKEKKSGFGVSLSSGGGSASIGIGFGSSTDKSVQSSETNAVSTLKAGNDLIINAGRNANLQAAQVSAERDVDIRAAKDVNLLSAQDKSNYEEVHKKLFAGITLSVSSGLISAASSAASSAERIESSSGTKAVSNVAMASLNAYQALRDAKNIMDAKQGTNIISGDLSVGFQYSKNTAAGSSSTPVPTVIRGGNSVTVEASSGDLTGHGVQVAAGYDAESNRNGKSGDIALIAGKDVTLESAQETSNHSSKNKSVGAKIGLGFSADIDANGSPNGSSLGLQGGFNFSKGSADGNAATQLNSHVNGTGNVRIQSGKDTALKGAVVDGRKVEMDVGHDLIIESQLDTAREKARQLGVNGSVGVQGSNLGGTYQKANGDAALVGEQSGVHAGEGGFDITVQNQTSLTGGLITSEADPAKNRLETGTLDVTDLDTHSNWKARTYGGGIGTGGVSVSPAMKDGETETGKALSAISPGEIIITDPADQTLKIEDIRRDTDDTNTSLPGIEDLQKVLREQSETQGDYNAAAKMLTTLIGDLSAQFKQAAHERGDKEAEKFWDAGSPGPAALHALGGALIGGVNGGAGAIKAALGGAIASLTGPQIRKLVEKIVGTTELAGTPAGENLINAVAASLVTGVAAAAGGSDAAAYANNEVKYNYLKHKEIKDFTDELKNCKGDASCEKQVGEKYKVVSDTNNQALVKAIADRDIIVILEALAADNSADIYYNSLSQLGGTSIAADIFGDVYQKGNEINLPGGGTDLFNTQAFVAARDIMLNDALSGKRSMNEIYGLAYRQLGEGVFLPNVAGVLANVAASFTNKTGTPATNLATWYEAETGTPPKKATQNSTVKVDIERATKGTAEYEALNDPPANTRVELNNGTAFKTNEGGYVEKITYTPIDMAGIRDTRQTAVGREGLASDVGGHIQACAHGGSCDRFNLFPQNSNFNNSAFKRWENEITRALKAGDTVGSVTVQFERTNPFKARPDALRVEYSINGVPNIRRFVNQSGGGQ